MDSLDTMKQYYVFKIDHVTFITDGNIKLQGMRLLPNDVGEDAGWWVLAAQGSVHFWVTGDKNLWKRQKIFLA